MSSVLFTSRPITAALSKRRFQIWLLLLSLYWISGIRTCTRTLASARISHREWNFTALDLNHRNHHNDSHTPSSGVARIDLLANNKVIHVEAQELGSSIRLSIPGDPLPQVDGWCFTTKQDHSTPDAVRFMLLASNGGMEWEQVGSSSSFLDSFGNVRHANGRFETPAARNATVCFSFSKYFFWVRCLLVTAKIVAALFWIAAGFAVAARENTGRVIVGSAQMLSAVTMACVAVSGVTQVGFAEASDLIVAASCILCFAYCFLVDEAARKLQCLLQVCSRVRCLLLLHVPLGYAHEMTCR